MRKAFTIAHRISNAVRWYGLDYNFTRNVLNEFNEPSDKENIVETIQGIFHSSQKSFIELVNTEAAEVKSKSNIGILCNKSSGSDVTQGDNVVIDSVLYKVTAVEPVMYVGTPVATEISLEEMIEKVIKDES